MVLATAAALGWLAATKLAAPLEGLTRAVDALAFGTAPNGAADQRHRRGPGWPPSSATERPPAPAHGRARARRAPAALPGRRQQPPGRLPGLRHHPGADQLAGRAGPGGLVLRRHAGGRRRDPRRAEVAHADQQAGRGVAARVPAGPSRRGASPGCSRTGVPELDPRDVGQPPGGDHARRPAPGGRPSLGVTSVIRVPLLARGRTLGVISLTSTDPNRRYGATDLALAEELGRRCAVAVDNARLYAESQQAIRAREFLSSPPTSPDAADRHQGYAQILAMASRRLDDERLLRRWRRSTTTADRLAALVDDLLDVSAIPTATCRCGSTVDLAARRLRGDTTATATTWTTSIPSPSSCRRGRPPSRSTWTAWSRSSPTCSRTRSSTRRPGTVRLCAELRPGGALVQVTDSGIGLPTESLEAIFQPFGRAPNATRRFCRAWARPLHLPHARRAPRRAHLGHERRDHHALGSGCPGPRTSRRWSTRMPERGRRVSSSTTT